MVPTVLSKIQQFKKVFSNKLVKYGYFEKRSNKRLIVVMYHGIDQAENTKYNLRFFSREHFEQQIALFKKHLNILSHEDFINERFSDTRMNVVLTFDDGYLNNHNYALPVLDKYNAHAYFFITGMATMEKKMLWTDATDIVSKYGMEGSNVHVGGMDFGIHNKVFVNRDTQTLLKTFVKQSAHSGYEQKQHLVDQLLSIHDFTKAPELNDYWKLMGEKEILAVSRSRHITVGSHGFYHNNLGSLAHEDAVQEVQQSKRYLENIIQKEVNTIGFPDGSYTERLNDALHGLGFAKQFLVNYNFSDEGNKKYVYNRLGLYPYMGNHHQILHKTIQ